MNKKSKYTYKFVKDGGRAETTTKLVNREKFVKT